MMPIDFHARNSTGTFARGTSGDDYHAGRSGHGGRGTRDADRRIPRENNRPPLAGRSTEPECEPPTDLPGG